MSTRQPCVAHSDCGGLDPAEGCGSRVPPSCLAHALFARCQNVKTLTLAAHRHAGIAIPGFPQHAVAVKYATEHRCGVVVRGAGLCDAISGTDPLRDNLPLQVRLRGVCWKHNQIMIQFRNFTRGSGVGLRVRVRHDLRSVAELNLDVP